MREIFDFLLSPWINAFELVCGILKNIFEPWGLFGCNDYSILDDECTDSNRTVVNTKPDTSKPSDVERFEF